MQYGVINNQTNLCENVVELTENSTWQPPEGYFVEPLVPNAGIGWTFENGQWIEPPPPPEPELPDQPATSGTQEL
jgi:hypothetical protein